MKISLGIWAFSFGPFADHPVSLEKVLERSATAGYDGVELSGFPPHVTLESYPSSPSRYELARRLHDLNLGISGYSADFSSVNPGIDENRGRYLDLFRRNLELCADLGSPVIRVDTGSAPGAIDERDYPAAMDRLAALWQEAASLAGECGVRLAWEFEPGFAFNKPSEILALHRKVDHRNFTIMFDTAHAYMCGVAGARQEGRREVLQGGIPAFLKLLSGRIGSVHLIDSDGTLYADETSTHRPFGEGYIDFPALTPALLAIPNIDWWCVDLCFWPAAWDLVERELAFVRRLLPQPIRAS